jgi:putative acetyltransferase
VAEALSTTVTGVQIRVEGRDDADAVAQVHREAFGDEGAAVAALVCSLRELIVPGRGASLVATADGRVVGHVMLTRSLLDAPRRLVDVLVLSPLGVVPARQREGIGSALVRRAVEVAIEQAAPVVFLEGSPVYYPRFGFAPGADQGFRKPSLRIPDAAFQALRLPAHEPWMTGTLIYSAPFWDHDLVGLRDGGHPGS